MSVIYCNLLLDQANTPWCGGDALRQTVTFSNYWRLLQDTILAIRTLERLRLVRMLVYRESLRRHLNASPTSRATSLLLGSSPRASRLVASRIRLLNHPTCE